MAPSSGYSRCQSWVLLLSYIATCGSFHFASTERSHHHGVNKHFVTAFASKSFSLPESNEACQPLFPAANPHEILNPLTGRMIKQQSGTENKKSRWYHFMYEIGGYIAYRSTLAPLELKRLITWEQEELETDIHKKSNSYCDNNSDSLWYHVSPSFDAVDEARESIETKDVPYLDQILFVHKPANLLTLPGIDEPNCLANHVNKWLFSNSDTTSLLKIAEKSAKRNVRTQSKKKRQKKKTFVPRPCHRLDRDTSGVMVIALTPDAIRTTSALFEERFVQKHYVALVAGHLENDTGFCEYSIGKVYNPQNDHNEFRCHIQKSILQHKQAGSIRKVSCDDLTKFTENSLRSAKAEWAVSKRFTIDLGDGTKAKYSRVVLKPKTGRGHQLRLHMASLGHPILGDTLHAPSSVASVTPRLCLHAEKLEIDVQTLTNGGGLQKGRIVATSIPPF
jgi:tRNA pseudouridine32 synthase/23S rRNA pseudouridine746 synthase